MRWSLERIDWPDFGRPATPPTPDLKEMEARVGRIHSAMEAHNLDCLVIYGDREHSANIRWASGFDPRFEEAVLIIRDSGRPILLAGNECLPYTAIAPMVAAGSMEAVLCPSLSLLSQPRSPGERLDRILKAHIPTQARIGTVGWKYWEAGEFDDPTRAMELPAIIVDVLRGIGSEVVNATAMFMSPADGLRSTVDAAGIARLEFANHMAASAIRRMIFSFREGQTDFEALEAARIGGLPLGCHPTFATGEMADQGLTGPTGQRLTRGQKISFNICHWGANICRAGWLVSDPSELPKPAHDYLDAFAGPYVAALSDWFSQMRPGVPGGQVWDQVMRALPVERFGITLNPGHLIGDDEWISSPIYAGSDIQLRSGMPMQCDIIPGHADFGSTRMEDGYVIADEELQAKLESAYPEVAARCAARRAFMRDQIGLDVPDTLLPLADTCGIVAPWLLDPAQVITLRG